MYDYSPYDSPYESETRRSSDGGCCGCLILIFAVVGFFTFLGWIF